LTTLVISNAPQYPFGAMTNSAVSRLISLNATLARLDEAITTASSGYTGTAGTQFEIQPGAAPTPAATPMAAPPIIGGAPLANATAIPTLFGVVASDTPGEQGVAYRYAAEQLWAQWQAFWAAAAPFIEQLDNGNVAI
jgi:hypothetical protein